MIDSVRCEVLNVTYEPLGFIPARRGLRLLIEGKASIVEEHPTLVAQTVDDVYPIPVRVVLKRLVKSRETTRIKAQLTPRNLKLRDNYTCQYCNRHQSELGSGEILTREHIHPQEKGGKDVWTNVVIACNPCNNKKANMLLDEFETLYPNLKLRNRTPHAPTVYEIHSRAAAMRERNKYHTQ